MDWDQIVDALGPRLFGYFCASFDEAAAHDLVQETFLRLHKKLSQAQFDPQKGNLSMYAFGIARYVRLERRRDQFSEPNMVGLDEVENVSDGQADASQKMLRFESFQQLREALLQLKPVQQDIVLLHFDEELSLVQIAQLLELPLNTIKSHLHRAKAQLHSILTSAESPYESRQ